MITFKELAKKLEHIQNMLLEDYDSPETFSNVIVELSDLRVFLLHPEIFIDECKKEK